MPEAFSLHTFGQSSHMATSNFMGRKYNLSYIENEENKKKHLQFFFRTRMKKNAKGLCDHNSNKINLDELRIIHFYLVNDL